MAMPLSTNDSICCLKRQIADLRSLRTVLPFRTGTAWPVAADIPLGTGVDWFNSTANAMRHYVNQGGTVRYITFTT